MKAQLFDVSGAKKGDIELPAVFDTPIREDLASKYFEALKFDLMHPYSPSPTAGRRHSASGTIRHSRHKWKGHYGKGLSRVPRKKMWRRGTQFYWIGAEVSNTRGGRSVHTPTGVKRIRKINAKERTLALSSGFAATTHKEYVVARYHTLKDAVVPLVINQVPQKTKDVLAMLQKILGSAYSVAIRTKSLRAGKGKRRGRRYKTSAGLLLVTGAKEKVSCSAIDAMPVKKVNMGDLYPLGRLTIYTQQALEELKHA